MAEGIDKAYEISEDLNTVIVTHSGVLRAIDDIMGAPGKDYENLQGRWLSLRDWATYGKTGLQKSFPGYNKIRIELPLNGQV